MTLESLVALSLLKDEDNLHHVTVELAGIEWEAVAHLTPDGEGAYVGAVVVLIPTTEQHFELIRVIE